MSLDGLFLAVGLVGCAGGVAIGGAIGHYQENRKKGMIYGGIIGAVMSVALATIGMYVIAIAASVSLLFGIALSIPLSILSIPLSIMAGISNRLPEASGRQHFVVTPYSLFGVRCTHHRHLRS